MRWHFGRHMLSRWALSLLIGAVAGACAEPGGEDQEVDVGDGSGSPGEADLGEGPSGVDGSARLDTGDGPGSADDGRCGACAPGTACNVETARCVEVDEVDPPPAEALLPDGLGSGGAGGARAVAWGGLVGEYCGVPAYSNQNNRSGNARYAYYDGTDHFGLQHQCTSFAMRFLCTIHGDRLPPCAFPQCQGTHKCGDARRWWLNGANNALLSLLERHPNGGHEPPRPGDVLVFEGGGYGHVAIIREVAPGFDSLAVIEQNVDHSTQDGNRPLAMSRGANGGYVVHGGRDLQPVGWMRVSGAAPGCGYQRPALVSPNDDARLPTDTVRLQWVLGDERFDHSVRVRDITDGDDGPVLVDRNVGLGTELEVTLRPGRFRWTVYNRDPACAAGQGDPDGRCAAPARRFWIEGGVGCDPTLRPYCDGASLRERDECGTDRLLRRCEHGCAHGACAPEPGCQPRAERYCRDGGVFERDGCGSDLRVEDCPHGCAGGICEGCTPRPQPYCQGDEVRERDGCGSDRRVEHCPHGCAGGICEGCTPRLQQYCRGDELRERDGCDLDQRVRICDHRCEGDRCVACRDRCFAAGNRDPRPEERTPHNPAGQAIRLRVEDTSDCDRLRLRATRVAGGALGAGRYFLRVGSCQEFGVVREGPRGPGPDGTILFTTDHRGVAGEEKEFCVTKEDGGSTAWWFSNFATVSRACD